jgi:hypothetical protein
LTIRDRWTEDELKAQIQRIGRLIERATLRGDQRSRCAVSYLTQVLRDRHDTLAKLRSRRRLN